MKHKVQAALAVAGVIMWFAGGAHAETEQQRLIKDQQALIDQYQKSVAYIETGPLRLFHLLVTYVNHELATAQLVNRRIFGGSYPETLKSDLDAFKKGQTKELQASTGLSENELKAFQEHQRLALRTFKDEQLMTFVVREVEERDQHGHELLDEMIDLVKPDDRTLRRVERKQRKLDKALNGVVTAYKELDLSDHRLSTRVDRIKDFRLERITQVLAMVTKPADQAIDASIAQSKQLNSAYSRLQQRVDSNR